MACLVGCFVVAEFLLTSASRSPSAIAEPLVYLNIVCCRMMASHSAEYSFVPKSWILPDELVNFQQHCKEMKRKGISRMYIVKPLTAEAPSEEHATSKTFVSL